METINPQQLVAEAQAEYGKGNYLSAARSFKAAADSFITRGEELQAAEMLNNCSVAYLKAGEAQAALDAASETDLNFATHGDKKRQGMAVGNQAAALEALKHSDEAMVAYEKSAELLKEAGEFELRAYVLQSLSELQLKRGRYLEAYTTMRAGVVGIKKTNIQQKLVKALMEIPFKFLK